MEVRFLQDGESPEFGVFAKGEIREFPETVCRLLIKRGMVEEVKQTKATVKVDKEV